MLRTLLFIHSYYSFVVFKSSVKWEQSLAFSIIKWNFWNLFIAICLALVGLVVTILIVCFSHTLDKKLKNGCLRNAQCSHKTHTTHTHQLHTAGSVCFVPVPTSHDLGKKITKRLPLHFFVLLIILLIFFNAMQKSRQIFLLRAALIVDVMPWTVVLYD